MNFKATIEFLETASWRHWLDSINVREFTSMLDHKRKRLVVYLCVVKPVRVSCEKRDFEFDSFKGFMSIVSEVEYPTAEVSFSIDELALYTRRDAIEQIQYIQYVIEHVVSDAKCLIDKIIADFKSLRSRPDSAGHNFRSLCLEMKAGSKDARLIAADVAEENSFKDLADNLRNATKKNGWLATFYALSEEYHGD